MKKTFLLVIIVVAFMLTGCATLHNVFQANPHPELNREFNWRYDDPGEYPH